MHTLERIYTFNSLIVEELIFDFRKIRALICYISESKIITDIQISELSQA